MKTLPKAFVLSILSLSVLLTAITPAKAVDVDPNTYAAVAFSQSTGKYGYAWNHGSRYSAERAALSECPHPDAKIVGWVNAGWLAVAIGDNNAYGSATDYGDGASNTVAKKKAIEWCLKHDKKVVTLICLCSGDFPPEIIKEGK